MCAARIKGLQEGSEREAVDIESRIKGGFAVLTGGVLIGTGNAGVVECVRGNQLSMQVRGSGEERQLMRQVPANSRSGESVGFVPQVVDITQVSYASRCNFLGQRCAGDDLGWLLLFFISHCCSNRETPK